MSLTKEQYLDYLEEEAEFYAEGYEAIKKLINEHFELVENFKQLEKNYDDLYDEKENTIGFKHFRLLADSTLKSWGKEALLEYIHMLYRNWKNTDCDYNRTIDFANELLDEIEQLQINTPLKFEEIKPTMCVYIKELNINGVVLNVDKDEVEVLFVQLANKETNMYDRFHEWFEFDKYTFYECEVRK